jgi:hypothetical protein
MLDIGQSQMGFGRLKGLRLHGLHKCDATKCFTAIAIILVLPTVPCNLHFDGIHSS